MSSQEAVNHLEKLLKSHQTNLNISTDDLIGQVSGENLAQKKATAGVVLKQLQEIKTLAPKSKIPSWLEELETKLSQFSQSQLDGPGIIRALVALTPEIKKHEWLLDETSSSGFDFEEIFNDCRVNSRIPELFDSIIELLEQIRDSGELDSRNMIDALSKIIATLQVGKQSSCFSLEGSWQFLCSFLENYFWAEAKKLPGLGSVVEALETTIKDAQIEMAKLSSEVRTEMSNRVKKEVRFLQKSEHPIFASYGKNGELISPPEYNSSGQEYVV